MTKFRILLMVGLATASARSQTTVLWNRTFGGTNAESARIVKPTSDQGYIIAGYSFSPASSAKSAPAFGAGDFWVVKTDASGSKQWDKSFGGTNFESVAVLQQTLDGGFILAGTTYSGASGNKTSTAFGGPDIFVVKIDSLGNRQWDKTFGGSSNDVAAAVRQTSDGGYIIAGSSDSPPSGSKSAAHHGASDFWVIKLDTAGNKLWEQSFGGSDTDELSDIELATDGGLILAGTSFSGASGNKTSGSFRKGQSDFWILKLEASGTKQWERTLGGTDAEEARTVRRTLDGGYLVAGNSYSETSGSKTAGAYGSHDLWLVKLTAAGTTEWERSYGGADAEDLQSAEPLSTGGYIVSALSASGVSGNKSALNTNAVGVEHWLLKLDPAGNKQWEKSFAPQSPAWRVEPSVGGFISNGESIAANDSDFALILLSPELELLPLVRLPNGTLQAQATGIPTTNYTLFASTNLVHWQPRRTNTANANGLVTFTLTETNTRNFYRVRQQ